MTEYNLLDKSTTYDVEKVRQLAQAMNEFRELTAQVKYLGELINDNQELGRYIHNTRDGQSLAIADMSDSHLENLLRHIQNRGDDISKELVGEARKRGISVPAASTRATARLLESTIDDEDDDIDLTDIPF